MKGSLVLLSLSAAVAFAPGAPAMHRAAPLRRMFEFGGEDDEAGPENDECSTDARDPPCFEITFFKN